MTASYNPALTNPVSRVRFAVGDTDVTAGKYEVEDATINALISQGMSETRAAMTIAYSLSAKYAKMADLRVDDQLQHFSHISAAFAKTGDRLYAQAQAEDPAVRSPDNTYGQIMVTGGDFTNSEWLYGCYPR